MPQLFRKITDKDVEEKTGSWGFFQMGKLSFTQKSNPKAYALYEEIRKTYRKTFDIGVPAADFRKPEKKEVDYYGIGDGKETPQEILRVALDILREGQASDGRALRKAVERYMDYSLPWYLSPSQQKKVTQITEEFTVLARSKKELVFGLFYFIFYPPNSESDPLSASLVENELQRLGLGHLKSALRKRGGFDLLSAAGRGNPPRELNAQETVEERRGFCTELSKVLYAIYRQAGLDAFFAQTQGVNTIKWIREQPGFKNRSLHIGNFTTHTFLGIRVGSEVLYVDPLLQAVNVEYRETKHLTEFNYMVVDMINSAAGLARFGKWEEMRRLAERANHLDPYSAVPYMTMTHYYYDKSKDYENGLKMARKALALFPNSDGVHVNMAIGLDKSGRSAEAILFLRKAVTLANRKNVNMLIFLARMEWEQGNRIAAAKLWDEAVALSPPSVLQAVGLNPQLEQWMGIQRTHAIIAERATDTEDPALASLLRYFSSRLGEK